MSENTFTISLNDGYIQIFINIENKIAICVDNVYEDEIPEFWAEYPGETKTVIDHATIRLSKEQTVLLVAKLNELIGKLNQININN